VACINVDGTLTRSGALIILVLRTPLTPEEVSKQTGEALFRVRSALREFLGVGFIEVRDDKYCSTPAGLAKLEGSPAD
jgi:hypothetical protein